MSFLYRLHSVEDFSLCTFNSHCNRCIHDYSSFAVCVAVCAASSMSSFLSMLCKSSVFVSSADSLVTTSAVSFGLELSAASSGILYSGSSAFLFLLFYPLLHVPDTNIPLLNSSVAVDHFVSFPSLPTSKGCLNVSVPVIEPSSKLTFRNL